MSYEITIRNKWGEKIVRRAQVDDLGLTLREIIEDEETKGAAHMRVEQFIRDHGRENLKYFWYPDAIPAPPPQPVNLDMANVLLLFRAAITQNMSRDFDKTIAELLAAQS